MANFFPDISATGSFRSLYAWEHAAFAAHLLRLNEDDLRARFLGCVADDFVRSHAKKTLASGKAKVIGWFLGGELRGTAEMHWSDDHAAEAAFTVEQLYRAQHVGTELTRRLLRAAANRKIERVHVITTSNNLAMRRLGAAFGAKFVADEGCVEGRMVPDKRSGMSVVFEIAEENRSFWLDLQSKMLSAFSGAPLKRVLPRDGQQATSAELNSGVP